MNLNALSMTTIRYAAHIVAIAFGGTSMFMLWAGFYYPPAWERGLIYFVLATGIELVRPKR